MPSGLAEARHCGKRFNVPRFVLAVPRVLDDSMLVMKEGNIGL